MLREERKYNHISYSKQNKRQKKWNTKNNNNNKTKNKGNKWETDSFSATVGCGVV